MLRTYSRISSVLAEISESNVSNRIELNPVLTQVTFCNEDQARGRKIRGGRIWDSALHHTVLFAAPRSTAIEWCQTGPLWVMVQLSPVQKSAKAKTQDQGHDSSPTNDDNTNLSIRILVQSHCRSIPLWGLATSVLAVRKAGVAHFHTLPGHFFPAEEQGHRF